MTRPASRAWVMGCCLGLVSVGASAQVRHRRPLTVSPAVRYGYDNNGGSSGCRDYNCGSRCYDGHSGTDFPVPLGSTVLASADGVVSATNNGCANYGGLGNSCGGRCGNYVQIRHSDGAYTIFCHMQLGSLAVSRGQRVRCGQTLGRSASSGNSTGPHLHFGWRRTATSIDSFRGRCTSSAGAWTDQNAYGSSPGATCACVPSAETCNNRDDDCDGRVDDGLSRSCYTGPSGTAGRGICRNGSQSCGAGRWGGCSGQVVPRAETCNRLDDDCDGRVDDGVCATDAGTRLDVAPPRDVGSDVGRDVGNDVPRDAGNDIGSDVGNDVGSDVGNDVGSDVGNDVGNDDDAGVEEDVADFEDVGEDEPTPEELDPGLMAPEEPGCGCGVVGSAGRGRGAWALLLGAALVALGRRRPVYGGGTRVKTKSP